MRFLIVCALLTLSNHGFSQDIEFPKEEEALHLSGNNANITDWIPVYEPMACPENMLLYPGPGPKSTWSCDCKPGYLYFPQNNTCHAAYRQGPCPVGYYVYLPPEQALPRCVENSCREDGFVPYMGSCHKLGESGASCSNGIVKIHKTTYNIECAPKRPN